MKHRFALALFCASFALLGHASFAHAQTTTDSSVSVSLSPQNPGPNQPVTISLTSYAVDLSTANIEWSSNNDLPKSGVGNASYTITTKGLGVTTNVSVIVTPINDAPIQKTISITPMSVDVLWEATNSTVPPFYRGKAMPTSESDVKFVAIPEIVSADGTLVPSGNLVYDWQEDYTDEQDMSGYGRDSYATAFDYLDPTKDIIVGVSSLDGTASTEAEINISPSTPKLVLYASSPLYGPLFDQALGTSYNVTGSETSIYAEPYFFSPGNPSSNSLAYTWEINGQSVATPPVPNSLFLQRDTSSKGDATLDLSVTNSTLLFQSASTHLDLTLN